MGAILSKGIIDAGGRNCSLALGSRNGFTKMTSAVGLALWLQHWHWYPMMHMFSLALTPTFTIGLNKVRLDLLLCVIYMCTLLMPILWIPGLQISKAL
jgi:hypothetical protein